MKCSVCGRKLRNSKSQEVGYGPVCYRKLFGVDIQGGAKSSKISADDAITYVIPGQILLEDYLQMILEE